MLASSEPFAVARDLAAEIEYDVTPDHLYDALPDDATVCVVGWPDLVGDAVMRRGDVRVLAVDANDEGSSFVRRLQRADVDAEVVPAAGMSAAALAADIVLIEALACGPSEALAATGSRALASVGYCSEVPTWLVAGRGRRLPEPLFAAVLDRVADVRVPWEAAAEPLPLALFTAVVGPDGVVAVEPAAAGIDGVSLLAAECPVAYELTRPSPL